MYSGRKRSPGIGGMSASITVGGNSVSIPILPSRRPAHHVFDGPAGADPEAFPGPRSWRSNARAFLIAYPSRSLLKYAHTRLAPLALIRPAHAASSAFE